MIDLCKSCCWFSFPFIKHRDLHQRKHLGVSAFLSVGNGAKDGGGDLLHEALSAIPLWTDWRFSLIYA